MSSYRRKCFRILSAVAGKASMPGSRTLSVYRRKGFHAGGPYSTGLSQEMLPCRGPVLYRSIAGNASMQRSRTLSAIAGNASMQGSRTLSVVAGKASMQGPRTVSGYRRGGFLAGVLYSIGLSQGRLPISSCMLNRSIAGNFVGLCI